MINLRDRLFPAGVHFGISLVIAALAWALVSRFLYPYPFIEIWGPSTVYLARHSRCRVGVSANFFRFQLRQASSCINTRLDGYWRVANERPGLRTFDYV